LGGRSRQAIGRRRCRTVPPLAVSTFAIEGMQVRGRRSGRFEQRSHHRSSAEARFGPPQVEVRITSVGLPASGAEAECSSRTFAHGIYVTINAERVQRHDGRSPKRPVPRCSGPTLLEAGWVPYIREFPRPRRSSFQNTAAAAMTDPDLRRGVWPATFFVLLSTSAESRVRQGPTAAVRTSHKLYMKSASSMGTSRSSDRPASLGCRDR